MIDILDGAANADPGSCLPPGLRPATQQDRARLGRRGHLRHACPTAPATTASAAAASTTSPTPATARTGRATRRARSENEAEAQRSSAVRDFPGLFERMNEPFLPAGLKRRAVVRHLRQPRRAGAGQPEPQRGARRGRHGLREGHRPARGRRRRRRARPARTLLVGRDARRSRRLAHDRPAGPAPAPAVQARVHRSSTSSPPARRPATASPPDNLASGQGYYAFTPAAGRCASSCSTPSPTPAATAATSTRRSSRWLDDQLDAADTAGELTLVFAHHTLETMNQAASPFPPGDNPPPPYEAGPSRRGPRAQSPARGARPGRDRQVPVPAPPDRGRLHHRPRAPQPRPRGAALGRRRRRGERRAAAASGRSRPPRTSTGRSSRGCSTSSTTATARVSLWGTILDHDAPREPGRAGSASSPKQLASISRELSFNDPDADNGEDGRGDARGGEGDRNVELVVRDPR